MSFTTVSPSKHKDLPVIRQHLKPVLEYVHKEHPTSQLCTSLAMAHVPNIGNKGISLSSALSFFKSGFEAGTWNFFWSQPWKGAPDRVGGSLNRTADRMVSQGTNIPDAATLYQFLKASQTSVNLFLCGWGTYRKALRGNGRQHLSSATYHEFPPGGHSFQ